MGGMSIWHMLILLIIVLIFFGPNRLGDLGKSLGEAIRGFKKGLNEDPEIDVTKRSREQLQNQVQAPHEQKQAQTETEKEKA